MDNIELFFSSKTNHWSTPNELFNTLNKEFEFTLDPCATKENAKCKKYYTKKENGLIQDWSNEIVFMNPPYGREIKHWIQKAYEESLKGAIVVCLVPARTDTIYWHNYCLKGKVRFIKGRLKFGNSKNSAPFPSAIVVFTQKNLK
jgi:phage N-6-adenine-methyltransferase|tara:strand:+ start:69 stop:503 length:435 start_codon:yes stop_codon:yes gene_type:complete